MTRIPDSDINLGDSPDSSFENLYITGKLNYGFENDDVTLTVSYTHLTLPTNREV